MSSLALVRESSSCKFLKTTSSAFWGKSVTRTYTWNNKVNNQLYKWPYDYFYKLHCLQQSWSLFQPPPEFHIQEPCRQQISFWAFFLQLPSPIQHIINLEHRRMCVADIFHVAMPLHNAHITYLVSNILCFCCGRFWLRPCHTHLWGHLCKRV